jgi:hypothetical protein
MIHPGWCDKVAAQLRVCAVRCQALAARIVFCIVIGVLLLVFMYSAFELFTPELRKAYHFSVAALLLTSTVPGVALIRARTELQMLRLVQKKCTELPSSNATLNGNNEIHT